MKKQSLITILLTVLMSVTGAKTFAHDIEVVNNDEVTIYYKWINSYSELEVTYRGSNTSSYSDEYSGDVVIPESVDYKGNTYPVTSIGENAFFGCSGLTSVTIGNNVKSIGYGAFDFCSGLTSVTISKSVTSISLSIFTLCSSLTSIQVESGNPNYDSRDNCNAIIETSTNKLIAGCGNTIIPNNVVAVADHAFFFSSLNSVILPNSLTSIGDDAFCGCNLTSIIIPKSVTSIGKSAFDYCSSLVTIVSEIKTPFEIGSIGNSTATLIVPAGTKAVYQSTTGWSSFTKMVEIGEGGFAGCIFEIDGICYTIGENNTASLTSANKTISGAAEIPSQMELNGKKYDVTFIGDDAFRECSDLTSVTIGNNVTSIGDYAFMGCSSLTSLVIGSGVLSIGSGAFYNTNLKKTIWLTNTLPSGYSNAEGAVNYVSNDQFNIRDRVVYNFLSSYFDVDGIRYVPVSPSERTCDAIDCTFDASIESINIGETVTNKGVTLTVKKVNPYTCYQNKYIKDVKLSFGGDIGDYAFSGCSFLETADLGQKIPSIGNYAFAKCYNLKSIVIPDAVTTLGSYAFQYCSAMVYAKIGSGVETIHDYAFSGCSSLGQLQIPKTVTTIDNYAFKDCSSLKKLIIADSKRSLSLGSNGSDPLFSSCPLDSVYIGRDISYATSSSSGYSPFYRNTSLRAVRITNRETEISENEFYGCTNLQRVRIGNGVTKIGNWAFSGCSSLKFFSFGSTVKEIGQNAFSDCTSVVEIISKAANPPTCETQALDDINKWECKLYVPNGCKATYQGANQWKDFFFVEEGSGTVSPDGDEDAIAGDANCDGDIDESDVNAIANHILSNETAGFSVKNADVNEDGHVDVADIVIVNNIIDFESDPDAEDPVDPSTGNTLSDGISASFVSGAFIKVNDQILSGSKFGVKFRNGTGQTVVITKMQLNDAGTGAEGNNLLTEQVVVKAGEEVSYTITVGVNGIYKPVISFTYRYNYYTYQTEGYWFDYPQNNSGGGTEPVDHSNDYLVTDKMSASFTAGALIKINNMIMSGSKFGVKFNNNSNKTVTLTKMQLNDAETGAEGNNLLTEQVVVPAGGEVSYDNIAVGANGIYRPVICFTYQYNNTAYQVKGEWKE